MWRRISAINPSGVKPGDFSTAAHVTAPKGKFVSRIVTPPGSGHHLISGKINRMQDVTEHLILDRREKAIVAVKTHSNRVPASSLVTAAV